MTVNATRKWLMGQAMPTMDKLCLLANMLNTSEDWLRWGAIPLEEKNSQRYEQSIVIMAHTEIHITEKSFSQDFKLLTATNKKIVAAVMEVLLIQQQSLAVASKKNMG